MTEEAKRRSDGVKYILGHEWNATIIISLFTFLSFAFFFVWFIVKYFIDANIYSTLLDDLSNQESVRENLFVNQIIFSIISILVLPISFVLFGGVIGYVSNLNLKLKKPSIKEYFVSIKRNVKYSLFVGFVFAFLYNVFAFLKWYNDPIIGIILIGLTVLFILFIAPPMIILMFEGHIYQGKLLVAIKNSFLLHFSEPILNILFFLIFLSPIALFFVLQDLFVSYFLLLILSVYGFGLTLVVVSNRIFFIFDKYVNKFNYPELYEKNLDMLKKEN